MASIIVTGSAGRLGKSLGTFLASRGNNVTLLSREVFDLCNFDQVVRFTSRIKPELIFHPAAMTDVDACERNPEQAFRDNVDATSNLARAAAIVGARIVYFSTDYVFDGEKQTPYVETDTPNPLSVYGRTKLEGERLVEDFVQNYLIIRVSWLFGAEGDFCDFIRSRIKENLPLKLTTDHLGAPGYIPDLIPAVWKICKSDEKGIFHLTNSGECTRFQMGTEILRILKFKEKPEPVTGPQIGFVAKRPPQSVLSCLRYKRLFGEHLRPWQEALRDCLKDTG